MAESAVSLTFLREREREREREGEEGLRWSDTSADPDLLIATPSSSTSSSSLSALERE